VHCRRRIDVEGILGTTSTLEMVAKGDPYTRRVCPYTTASTDYSVTFRPKEAFQLAANGLNRFMLLVSPNTVGYRKCPINLIDVDSREIVATWLVYLHSALPATVRTFQIDIPRGKQIFKKILFKNLWDSNREYHLKSSDESIMIPRNSQIDIGAFGITYIRLWFSGFGRGSVQERNVYLFIMDTEDNCCEECYQFVVSCKDL
jgi:hypothetical protein